VTLCAPDVIIMLPVKVEERRKEEGRVVEYEWCGCTEKRKMRII